MYKVLFSFSIKVTFPRALSKVIVIYPTGGVCAYLIAPSIAFSEPLALRLYLYSRHKKARLLGGLVVVIHWHLKKVTSLKRRFL